MQSELWLDKLRDIITMFCTNVCLKRAFNYTLVDRQKAG